MLQLEFQEVLLSLSEFLLAVLKLFGDELLGDFHRPGTHLPVVLQRLVHVRRHQRFGSLWPHGLCHDGDKFIFLSHSDAFQQLASTDVQVQFADRAPGDGRALQDADELAAHGSDLLLRSGPTEGGEQRHLLRLLSDHLQGNRSLVYGRGGEGAVVDHRDSDHNQQQYQPEPPAEDGPIALQFPPFCSLMGQQTTSPFSAPRRHLKFFWPVSGMAV